MSILIKNMKMPKTCEECTLESYCSLWVDARRLSDDGKKAKIRHPDCPLVPVPPHGDLIDRDALIKDGWHNLHKEVMRMGGHEIYELPLKNPSIAVIIPAEESE